jgi:hypothetical protein
MSNSWAVTDAVLLFGMLPTLLAADAPKAVEVDAIEEKVSISLGRDFDIGFERDGDRLLKPSECKGTDAKAKVVKIKFAMTSASPLPPPRKGATRPILIVENRFEKTLHFRALFRQKGSKEFFEITDAKPLLAGETFNKCWDFDSVVEEVVLYEFKLSDKPAK